MITGSGAQLVGILGLSMLDGRVTDALRDLGVATPPLTPNRVQYATAKADGLDLLFKPPYDFRDGDSLGVRPDGLALSTVFFHAEGHEGYAAYRGDLPYGLRFDMSPAAVRALLDPQATADPQRRYNWNFAREYVAVRFTEDGQAVTLVTVGLPWSTGARPQPRPDPRREAAVALADRLLARPGGSPRQIDLERSGEVPPELSAIQREQAERETPFFADPMLVGDYAIALTRTPPGAHHYLSAPGGAAYQRFFDDVLWIGEDDESGLIGYWKGEADTFVGAPVMRLDNEGTCRLVGPTLVDYYADLIGADEPPLVDFCRRAGLPEPIAEEQRDRTFAGLADPDEVLAELLRRERAHICTAQPIRPLDRHPALVTLTDGSVVVVSNEDDLATYSHFTSNAAFLFDPDVRRFRALAPTAARLSLHGGGVGLLPDGRALFVETSDETYCLLFDPAAATWHGGTRLGTAHIHAGAAVLADGRLLVAGGEEAWTRPVNRCDLYDPRDDRWSETGGLAIARSDLAVVPVAGGALAIGGCLPGRAMDATDSCERYDADTGAWTPAAPLPFPMKMARALVTNSGMIFVSAHHGGWALYDPDRDVWTRSERLEHIRKAVVELAGDRVAFFTAPPGHAPEAVSVLDLTTGEFTMIGHTQLPRSDSAAALLPDGSVVLAGGDLFHNISKEPEVWDPATGRSQALPGMAEILDRQVRNLAIQRSIQSHAQLNE